MTLRYLLEKLEYKCIKGNVDIDVSEVVYNSKNVVPDSVFVCLKGSAVNSHKFAKEASQNGAVAIIAQEEIDVEDNTTVIMVEDTRKALAYISAGRFNHPANELTTIAVTGTKGKTTTANMIKAILEAEGKKTGVIGTLGVQIGDKIIKTNNTTPESYDIQKYMRQMADEGCKYVVMEASSLGLKWHRTDGFIFDYGIFTNFSDDHIGGNEHADLQEYLECKAMLFKQCKCGFVNVDDKAVNGILKNHTCTVGTFGINNNADIMAEDIKLVSDNGYIGVSFKLKGVLQADIFVDIPGKFNVYNALSAIAVCKEIVGIDAILKGLHDVKVKGRVELVPVKNGNYTLIIDYAHNAVSMENILTVLREYNPKRLITLFGAGGNRPKVRRYEMGEMSGKMSDLSVITADNSRFEDVMDIIEDIKVGIAKTNGKYIVIPDRKEAIRYCIENAQDGDIIVFAGKGHEDYQEIKGIKYHFDEREVISDIFKELGV